MITFQALQDKSSAVAVVGLGYVGLPLAVALSKHFKVIGFDISAPRIEELKAGHDRTNEVEDADLAAAVIEYTDDASSLKQAGVIIVAVPTPIDGHRRPELKPVVGASKTVGANMAEGSIVVYESTVYPGLTEEICVPLLEEHSGMQCGQGFKVGYSPERINPGDKVNTLETIVKVVAGQDEDTADLLCELYGAVVKAGVHRTTSIKVAEAAKVIENTQRDLNIALMNELSIIFDRLGIDTLEVLEAAGTKWNFLPFRPGLVGGHCIGVDPYYLTFKAQGVGLHPEVILAGRRINDNMGKHVAEKTVKLMMQGGKSIRGAKVGVMGITFKEDCPDLRNTRVVDVLAELDAYGIDVVIHDPIADPKEAEEELGVKLRPMADLSGVNALIVAVGHAEYKAMSPGQMAGLIADGGCLIDVKSIFDVAEVAKTEITYWRL